MKIPPEPTLPPEFMRFYAPRADAVLQIGVCSRPGPWPKLLDKPEVKRLETVERDGYTEHHVHVQVSLDGKTADGYLLLPPGKGPFPAAFVP
ncbi:MAG TPA: hypothetical protein VKH44_10005, partial [Pirellulaceae bacterium]|nr:hypothetical protein [Pirellulaceae bacterium]